MSSQKTLPIIQTPNFLKEALLDDTPVIGIRSARRCFAGDTLVRTNKGLVEIRSIKKGDLVLSYDTDKKQAEYREVLEAHKIKQVDQSPKPILQLKYANKTIKCTYDHEFYTDSANGLVKGEKRWIPAFVIAWGVMEADTKNEIILYGKQQGADIDSQLQNEWGEPHNEARARPIWLLQDGNRNKQKTNDNKGTQRSSKSVQTTTKGQECLQPQRQRSHKQQYRKLGVGNTKRECRTLCTKWQANKERWGEVWHSQVKRISGARNKKVTVSKYERQAEKDRATLWSGSLHNPRYSSRAAVAVSFMARGLLTECYIARQETTYDLTVANNHNYCITKDNILAHNTGKTYNFVIWLLAKLLDEDGTRGLHVDTSQSNIDKYIDRYYKPLLTKMNCWSEAKWNAQKKILRLHNNSYIDFGSSERPENLEGFEYDYALLNEAGIIFKKRSLYENTLQPMLKKAMVRAVGTPKGNNFFKTYCAINKSYHFTAHDSPFWLPEEIELAKTTMTQEAFRQEIMADFIDGAGAVFRNINENIQGELLDEPESRGRYALSADIAKHADFTVILIGDLTTKRVVWHDRFNQIDWGFQKQRIVNAYKKFNCVRGIIDATGVGDSVFDDLVNQGLNIEGFKFTSTSKQELVSNLSIAMDNGQIKYPNISTLIDELALYAYEQRANGQFSYSAPEGFHDDEVMSLALLNRLFIDKPVVYAKPRF